MPTACITTPGSRISLVSERLEIIIPQLDAESQSDPASNSAKTEKKTVPIRDLDRLILAENTQISGRAVCALLRADIPISWNGWNGKFLGGFQPCTNAHGAWRLRQYRRTLDPDFALSVAGRIVAAKIYNQRRVVQRLAANRKLDISEDLQYHRSHSIRLLSRQNP